jgi:tetratricopeptide (TPR) repeat protein
MILTQCAACAAPLPDLAKQCSRCKTRYCGPACQAQHWKEGGHDKLCKKIRRGGGGEQYHAAKEYAKAIAVAAKACAVDTQGQTCYICTQALDWKTKEGLVHMCTCRGTSGFAHVSCLAEQAKILCEEAEYNNLDMNPRFLRWYACSLCNQQYHGVVMCALGWACWKTYLGRPEEDQARGMAMTQLGNGLYDANHYEDALIVQETDLAMKQRLGASENSVLVAQSNLATTYDMLGRLEQALLILRDVYVGHLKFYGEEDSVTLAAANNYATSLMSQRHFEEAKSLLLKTIPVARRVLGESNEPTLRIRMCYALALYEGPGATLGDLCEAVNTLERWNVPRGVF